MSEAFTRKKVESLTLGEKIKKLRSQYRMSLADVSKSTKIQVKYLEYLENGEYQKLPAEVYVRGFLKGYARHLGLEEDVFLKLYDKEKNIQENLGKDFSFDPKPRTPLQPIYILTSRTIVLSLIGLIVFGTFAYLVSEFRSFVAEPTLEVFTPLPGAVIESSSVIVRGKTDRGTEVNINGQAVFVGGDGFFEENLVLQPGANEATVTAKNRFDNEKKLIVPFEGRFISEVNNLGQSPGKFSLILTVRSGVATVSIESDGTIVYSGELRSGESQTVEAVQEVLITSNRGSETLVSLRGGDPEPLSSESGAVSQVRYSGAGRQN